MYRKWLLEHRRTLILLVAGTMAALSMATAMAHQSAQSAPAGTDQPTLNTDGDLDAAEDQADEESEELDDVDEVEDEDAYDGTVEEEDVDEPDDEDTDDQEDEADDD